MNKQHQNQSNLDSNDDYSYHEYAYLVLVNSQTKKIKYLIIT